MLQGQSGFDELRRYMKQGGDFCKELSAILQERADAEAQYAKSLSKLSGKLSRNAKDAVGSVSSAWQHAAAQMEAEGEAHREAAAALAERVVRPLRATLEAQHRVRKSVESAVDKSGKVLAEWRMHEAKAKKGSFACARENERLQDALQEAQRLGRSARSPNVSDKEIGKLETKRRKAEESVKKSDVEYYTYCVRAERARLEWETAVNRGSQCFQALEEERLQHLKELVEHYHQILTQMCPKVNQSVERLNEPVQNCDVARDLQTVASVKGVGQPIPEQLLPDFYPEHVTLAMNRDRRRLALSKLLQLIRQDLDRERRAKQGVENLARALQQTPTFGNEDSQQNVSDKLHHMRSMLTYLEAARYKVQSTLAELNGDRRSTHPLASHIQVTRDRQGLQQSILKVPPWVREENMECPDWPDRGSGDGNSNQPDSDFDEFSSQTSDEKDFAVVMPVIGENADEQENEILPNLGQCRALYEYTANLCDELNLTTGDIITIREKQEDGWWLGELKGVVGIFPATYVEVLDKN
ncbi:Hypothetical predicted protein [Cloeon dipterum]|uniref:SH3 domain-containing protein n=1 Tax=Cloeon dipterum TaxID=197152 RepID=A0A8S1BXT3_9INSE|nr:Hypothetical predicted protein [Cloeon dipterum]